MKNIVLHVSYPMATDADETCAVGPVTRVDTQVSVRRVWGKRNWIEMPGLPVVIDSEVARVLRIIPRVNDDPQHVSGRSTQRDQSESEVGTAP